MSYARLSARFLKRWLEASKERAAVFMENMEEGLPKALPRAVRANVLRAERKDLQRRELARAKRAARGPPSFAAST